MCNLCGNAGTLRDGKRRLIREPLFTLTAAASIAMGIAANTTIFTIANARDNVCTTSGVIPPDASRVR